MSREALADGRNIQWMKKIHYEAADFHSPLDIV